MDSTHPSLHYTHEINLYQNVYVINLEKSKDRLQRIRSNLGKYGIRFKRFNAIYGKYLSQEEIDTYIHPLCQTLTCSKGFIGASLSHLMVWNSALQDDAEWTLILEDDVECHNDTIPKMNFVAEFIHTYIQDSQQPIIINLSPYNLLEPHQVHITSVDYLSGISAYLVNKSALRALVAYYTTNKIKFIIDLDMSKIQGIQKYSTSTQVFKTSFNINDAINKSARYSMPMFQSLVQLILCNNEFSQKLNFIINSSGIHLYMKYTIMNGWVVLFILAIIGMIISSNIIQTYVLIEIFLNFYQIILYTDTTLK